MSSTPVAVVHRGLIDEGFCVDWLDDGDASIIACSERRYDAAILDLGLPNRDGLQVLAELRRQGNTLPVIVVTARETVADRIKGRDLASRPLTRQP